MSLAMVQFCLNFLMVSHENCMIACDVGDIVSFPKGNMYWLLKLKMKRECLGQLGLGRPCERLACACLSTLLLNP